MASFIGSLSSVDQCPRDTVSEFVLVGRSNVGKSSVLNAMANATIARTSKTPGRTRLINLYDFKDFRIADLPGYGYAKVGNQQLHVLSEIIDTYLKNRPNLFGILQICDANVISEQDAAFARKMAPKFKHYYVLLNKTDKQNISVYQNNLDRIAKYLSVKPQQLILISAKKKINIDLVIQTIKKTLKIQNK
jgi:GTP-binding protein